MTVLPRYRYVVVPEWHGGYAIEDRTNGSLVAEGLTQLRARALVWDWNGRNGSGPIRPRAASVAAAETQGTT